MMRRRRPCLVSLFLALVSCCILAGVDGRLHLLLNKKTQTKTTTKGPGPSRLALASESESESEDQRNAEIATAEAAVRSQAISHFNRLQESAEEFVQQERSGIESIAEKAFIEKMKELEGKAEAVIQSRTDAAQEKAAIRGGR